MACGCNNSYYSLPCCCPQAPVGTTTTTTTTLCPDAIPCEEAYKSDCIIYNGPNLACYGIKTGDTVTDILNVIIAQLDPCTTTTTSTTTACVRPLGLNTYVLNTSINNVSFNASLEAACVAYNQYVANPGGSTLSGITGQGSSLSYGSIIYNGVATTCTFVPNGYYIIAGQPGVVTMINGVLTSLVVCPTTTTTTSTSTSTTTSTTTNPYAPYVCECINYTAVNNSGFDVTIPFDDCLTGQSDPDGIEIIGLPLGETVTFCACLDSIPEITGVTITPNGPCAVPTTTSTTTSTTSTSTTTSTTTVEPTTSTTTTSTTLEPTTSTTSTTTTTTADPSITTTTSTTTTVNPDITRIHLINNDLSFGMEISAVYDLGTGLIIPLDSGSYPVTSGQDVTITLNNGVYDFEVFVNNYDIRGSVTLIDSNGTPDCRTTDVGSQIYSSVYVDDAGGTSSSSITLLDAAC